MYFICIFMYIFTIFVIFLTLKDYLEIHQQLNCLTFPYLKKYYLFIYKYNLFNNYYKKKKKKCNKFLLK